MRKGIGLLVVLTGMLAGACSGGNEMAKGEDKSLSVLGGLMEFLGLKPGSGITTSPEDLFGNDPKLVVLAKAIRAGDVEGVKKAVAAGASVNGRGREGITPLLYAMSNRQVEVIKTLVALGANPFVSASFMESPLETAAASKYPELLRALLDAGCDPNSITERAQPLMFPAILHGRLENVRLLVERGADINALDSVGDTPLIESFLTARYDILEYLILKGADPRIGSINVADALASKNWLPGSEADLKAKQLIKMLADRGFTRETPVSWEKPAWLKWHDEMYEQHGPQWQFPGWSKGKPAPQ